MTQKILPAPRELGEIGLGVRQRRQLLGAGANGADLAVDRDFHQVRFVGLDRPLDQAFEVRRA